MTPRQFAHLCEGRLLWRKVEGYAGTSAYSCDLGIAKVIITNFGGADSGYWEWEVFSKDGDLSLLYSSIGKGLKTLSGAISNFERVYPTWRQRSARCTDGAVRDWWKDADRDQDIVPQVVESVNEPCRCGSTERNGVRGMNRNEWACAGCVWDGKVGNPAMYTNNPALTSEQAKKLQDAVDRLQHG